MSDYYEFGPFRLEVSTRSLYRSDQFVPVTPKVFETLLILVEDAGHVVTKEDLLRRIWPDAFVEDGSISNNVSTLRKILNPYFDGDGPIATVPRRGYRFTASVRLRSSQAGIQTAADRGPVPQIATETMAVPARITTRWYAAAAIIAGVAVLAVALIWRPATGATAASVVPRRSIAVLPMKNLSPDPAHAWLSIALAETISAELAAGNQFRLVSGENVVRMQQELAPPIGIGLTRKHLDEIGRDLASDLILSGSYLAVGSRVRVDVRLDDVATGGVIVATSITEEAKDLLQLVARAGSELRSKLRVGEPPTSDTDAIRNTFATNPDALRNYFQGLEALRRRDGPKARDFLLRATAADAAFVLAHSALSTTWRLLGNDKRGAEAARRAFEGAARLSPEDRLGVEAQYYEATAQWPKAIDLYQILRNSYPDNIEYGLKLGNAQWLGGLSADTLLTVAALRKLPVRDSRDPRIDMLEASAADSLSDFPRAATAAASAAEKALASRANLMLARARIKQGIYAYRQGKRDDALTFIDEAGALFESVGETGGMADAMRWDGLVRVAMGQFAAADKTFARAVELTDRLDYVRLSIEIKLGQADVARLQGDPVRSARLAEAAISMARETDNKSAIGRGLTNLGNALRLQGEYQRSRAAHQQSADLFSEIGDTVSGSSALNNLAVIDFLLGDLKAARTKYEAALVEDRRIGNRAGIALRLGNLSRVLALQGQLAEAETLTSEECRLQETLSAPASLAWCRVRLADLWVELARVEDARALLAKLKPEDLGSSVTAPANIARLARVHLNAGQVTLAADTIAVAEQQLGRRESALEATIQVSTIKAQIEAAQGRRASALARLTRATNDAHRLRLLTWELEARLAQSQLDATHARATEEAASEAGFGWIAAKARTIATAAADRKRVHAR